MCKAHFLIHMDKKKSWFYPEKGSDSLETQSSQPREAPSSESFQWAVEFKELNRYVHKSWSKHQEVKGPVCIIWQHLVVRLQFATNLKVQYVRIGHMSNSNSRQIESSTWSRLFLFIILVNLWMFYTKFLHFTPLILLMVDAKHVKRSSLKPVSVWFAHFGLL